MTLICKCNSYAVYFAKVSWRCVDRDEMVLLDSGCTGLVPTLADKRVCTGLTAISHWRHRNNGKFLLSGPAPLRLLLLIISSWFCHSIAQRFALEFSIGYMESSVSRCVALDLYEVVFCLCLVMNELDVRILRWNSLEQLQIKILWETACLVYS